MPFIKVYIHFVWSTKNREPYLATSSIRKQLWEHITENAKRKGIYISCINGYTDHCHCLVSLGSNQTIQEVIQLIKGESSFWMNQENIIGCKFEWQREYFAASVSERIIPQTERYIRRQETHHNKESYGNEMDRIIQIFGLEKYEG